MSKDGMKMVDATSNGRRILGNNVKPTTNEKPSERPKPSPKPPEKTNKDK